MGLGKIIGQVAKTAANAAKAVPAPAKPMVGGNLSNANFGNAAKAVAPVVKSAMSAMKMGRKKGGSATMKKAKGGPACW